MEIILFSRYVETPSSVGIVQLIQYTTRSGGHNRYLYRYEFLCDEEMVLKSDLSPDIECITVDFLERLYKLYPTFELK